MTIRALLVIGTRPEAIKMAPVVKECQRRAADIETVVCFTGQHRELLDQVAAYFGIRPDLDLDLMRPDQSLAALTGRCLEGIDGAIEKYQPDYVIAQGDTTTTLAASMAAFYRHVPFVHVEAGLRTGDLQSPWPEEFNRRAVGITTRLHCAPTNQAKVNLFTEGVDPELVINTGNTVIDALLWTVNRERANDAQWRDQYPMLRDRRLVLITQHRREHFGEQQAEICKAIHWLATVFNDTEFVYPVHPNPNVHRPVVQMLSGFPNVHLTKPATYPEFVWLMGRSYLILTDSGGVQEEAPTLGRPVLVLRDTTERPEAVECGAARLVGTSRESIVAHATKLLTDPSEYAKCVVSQNPYGDGHAAERIVDWLLESR